MVFTNLSPADKVAFFDLLDEYFASRPDVLTALNASQSSNGNASRAPPAPPRSLPASSHNASPNPSTYSTPTWKQQARAPSPAAQDSELPPSVGRVAAAAAAFRNSSAAPRPPPRKLSSYETAQDQYEETQPSQQAARTPPSFDRLVSQKKFGDVDLSSGKNAFLSIRHGTVNKTASPPSVAPPIPAALPPIKNTFGPPPVRRVSSTISQNSASNASPPPPPPPRPRVPEPQVEGDWAEAVYDYSSEDPGDLDIQAGQQILIVERASDDWWTGELQGRRGLVPAAYVKLL